MFNIKHIQFTSRGAAWQWKDNFDQLRMHPDQCAKIIFKFDYETRAALDLCLSD